MLCNSNVILDRINFRDDKRQSTHPVLLVTVTVTVTADLLAEALLLKGRRSGTLAAAIGAANRGDKAGIESVEQYRAKAKTKPK